MKQENIKSLSVLENEKQRYETIFPMPDSKSITSVDLKNNMKKIKKSLRKLARFIKSLIKEM